MSEFYTYLQLGLQHIADLNAYDHILFIVALCAVYQIREWKNILVLVTAFTIGHSLTLALSAFNIVLIPAPIIEFLIPVTIFLTALYNVSLHQQLADNQGAMRWNYALALGFGFIHGMGFSNYFKMLLGQEASIIQPLLAFNIGIEIGQLLIVAVILLASVVALRLLKIQARDWIVFLSGAAAGISLVLMMETKFW